MIVLAHAGGGDELLLVLVPTFVFMLVYRLVRGPAPEHRDASADEVTR